MSVGYPRPPAAFPNAPARPPSAGTAESLVLVALVLQVIGGVIVLALLGWLFGFSLLYPFPYAWAAVLGGAAVAVLVVAFLYFAYTLSYRRIRRGELAAAESPTLVIGILSLFFGVLPGIFYLIGYLKLGDAVREQQQASAQLAAGTGTGPLAQIACRSCGRVYGVGFFGFCPNCGQKLGS